MSKKKKVMPTKFPFWARFKKNKNRTTLVIDEEKIQRKNSDKVDDYYVHREATHTYKKDYEKLDPNPDSSDNRPMYLKRPNRHPKVLFTPHNKNLKMPKYLIEKYSKNNKKQ